MYISLPLSLVHVVYQPPNTTGGGPPPCCHGSACARAASRSPASPPETRPDVVSAMANQHSELEKYSNNHSQ